MGDLFGPKWTAKSGDITDESGAYSQSFLLWCRKLDGLTTAQFRHGMQALEYRAQRAGNLGEEFWPPSYAEFVGLACQNWETAAHKPFQRLALPDKGALERAKVAGSKALGDMKSLFGGAA